MLVPGIIRLVIRYSLRMDMVITHMSALELLRLPDAAVSLAPASDTPRIPTCIPSASELTVKREWLTAVGYAQRRLELLVSDPASRVRAKDIWTHTQQEALPASSFVHVGNGVWVVSPEHLCVQLAPALTRVELLVLLGELLGTYALHERGICSRPASLMTAESLSSHLDALGDFRGAREVRDALTHAPLNSASPMETKLFLRISLPYRLGGYALPVQALNERVEVERIGEAGRLGERRPDIMLLPGNGATADCAFVAIEYDGEVHLTRARQAADQRRSNEILACGGREYRVNKELYDDLAYMDELIGRVARDLGRKPSRVTLAVGEKRRRLRGELKRELDLIDGISWNGKERGREQAHAAGDAPAVDDVVTDERVPLDVYWF